MDDLSKQKGALCIVNRYNKYSTQCELGDHFLLMKSLGISLENVTIFRKNKDTKEYSYHKLKHVKKQ